MTAMTAMTARSAMAAMTARTMASREALSHRCDLRFRTR